MFAQFLGVRGDSGDRDDDVLIGGRGADSAGSGAAGNGGSGGRGEQGDRGQPATLIGLAPNGAYSLGVKIGRRSLDSILVDFAGKVIAQRLGLSAKVRCFVDFLGEHFADGAGW